VNRGFDWDFRWLGIGFSLALALAGCGSPGANACEAVAAALASTAGNCGLDPDKNHDAFIQAAAGGDCGTIHSVRDPDALYSDCIPKLEALTCAQINDPALAGQLPSSCIGQLLR
jgi:hypothetical protein